MSASRLPNQAMDGIKAAPRESKCERITKYCLAKTKAFTAMGQTFFGCQASISYTTRGNALALPNVLISSANAINSLFFTNFARGIQMTRPNKPKKMPRVASKLRFIDPIDIDEEIESTATRERHSHPSSFFSLAPELQHLSLIQLFVYFFIVFLSRGSQCFSSLAAYNGAFTLCTTFAALISSSDDDPSELISENEFVKYSVQVFALVCFCAQLLSFEKFQARTIKEYLLFWWLDPDYSDEQMSLFKKNYGLIPNGLLWFNFFTMIASATFFGIFSTQVGLKNLNHSLFKSILKSELPEWVLDIILYFSTACIFSMTTINTIPSVYNYFELTTTKEVTDKKNKNIHSELTNAGKVLAVMGFVDTACNTYATICGSINRLHKLFKIDIYDPYLIGFTAGLFGPTNLISTYIYNAHKTVKEEYPIKIEADGIYDTLLEADQNTIITHEGQLHFEPDTPPEKEGQSACRFISIDVQDTKQNGHPLRSDIAIIKESYFHDNPHTFYQPPTSSSRIPVLEDVIEDSPTEYVSMVDTDTSPYSQDGSVGAYPYTNGRV
jgi:hypothetical protein